MRTTIRMRLQSNVHVSASGASRHSASAKYDETRFAERELNKLLLRRGDELPPGLTMPPVYSWYMLILHFCASVLLADTMAHYMQLSQPLAGLLDWKTTLCGFGWGVPGAIAISRIERWRSAASCTGGSSKSLSAGGSSIPAVTQPALLGLVPLSSYSEMLSDDNGVGERTASAMVRHASPMAQASLLVCGTLASSIWTHAVVQSSMGAGFNEILGGQPALGSAPAMGFTVAATAALCATAETFLVRWLKPMTAATAVADEKALEHRRQQLPTILALNTPPQMAEHLAQAFEEAVHSWRSGRDEAARRDFVANCAHIAVSSLVFTISGGSLAAPFLANLGVCSLLRASICESQTV